MNVENPIAFSFIMQDDIYLLESEKLQYIQAQEAETIAIIAEPEPVHNVAPATPPVPEPKPEPVSFKYLGGHKKRFLIITYYPQHDFMRETHLAALESTLSRLGVSRDDVAIFNRANYAAKTFEAIAAFFKPQKLLILGEKSLPGELTIALNRPGQIKDFPALFTFSFDEMMDSVEHKKAFWEQMKQF